MWNGVELSRVGSPGGLEEVLVDVDIPNNNQFDPVLASAQVRAFKEAASVADLAALAVAEVEAFEVAFVATEVHTARIVEAMEVAAVLDIKVGVVVVAGLMAPLHQTLPVVQAVAAAEGDQDMAVL